ncbi:MAG: tetratricopeptide repeat protein [Verrucomicrobia bacterium]|nr:tetratricopeptide repeat protein [Verrucomicrobiota bacterium]
MIATADTPSQEFVQLYGHGAWKDWQRFLAHFDLGEGFSFLVLLLPGAVGANICRRQLSDHLTAKGKRLAELPCDWREDARRLSERLFTLEPSNDLGGIWLGTVIPKSDPEIQQWQDAWRHGLASLNQQRNPLLRRFHCPLVLVVAPWLHPLLREAAPDLWSLRTAVVAVTPSPEPHPPGEVVRRELVPFHFALAEAASDPDYALEQAERLRNKSGLKAARAQLLLRAGNGFYERVRFDPAEKCFREAAAILAALAPQSPKFQDKWAGALNNLANVLSTLGQREEALEKAQEALRIYEQLAKAHPDAFLPGLAMSCGSRGAVLRDLERHAEAAASFAQGIRGLEPLFRRSPAAFVGLIESLCRNYLKAMEKAAQHPDMALLAPVQQVVDKLKQDKPEDAMDAA